MNCLLLIPSSIWKLLIGVLRNQPRGTEENSPLLGHDVGGEYFWKSTLKVTGSVMMDK